MKLDFLDEAVRLRNRRQTAQRLADVITTGTIDFTVWDECHQTHVLGTINTEFVRSAVRHAVGLTIYEIDCRLAELGMCPKPPEPKPEAPDQLLIEIASIQNSWIRALGGRLKPKRHLIDALVMTTEETVERARKYNPETVPKAMHEARVTELLQFNNKLEERARAAERKLHAFMNGTDADRLAFAVEKAAAQVISDIKERADG
ncbi:hypothetical protein [Bradyrhizobium cenepequi]